MGEAFGSEAGEVDSQRRRLLWAIVYATAKKSYEAVTVADVVDQAAVSRSTFYEHFENKDQCLLAAYDMLTAEVLERVGEAYAEQDEWLAGVRAGLETFLEYFADHPEVARLAMVEIPAAGPEAHDRYRTAFQSFLPFLEPGREIGPIAEGLPRQSELMAVGGAEAIIFDEVSAGRAAQLPERLPDILFTLLVPYLGPEDAAAEMHSAAAA